MATTVCSPRPSAGAPPARSPTPVPGVLVLRIGFTVAPILFGLDKFLELARRLARSTSRPRSTTSSPATPTRRCSPSA